MQTLNSSLERVIVIASDHQLLKSSVIAYVPGNYISFGMNISHDLVPFTAHKPTC